MLGRGARDALWAPRAAMTRRRRELAVCAPRLLRARAGRAPRTRGAGVGAGTGSGALGPPCAECAPRAGPVTALHRLAAAPLRRLHTLHAMSLTWPNQSPFWHSAAQGQGRLSRVYIIRSMITHSQPSRAPRSRHFCCSRPLFLQNQMLFCASHHETKGTLRDRVRTTRGLRYRRAPQRSSTKAGKMPGPRPGVSLRDSSGSSCRWRRRRCSGAPCWRGR